MIGKYRKRDKRQGVLRCSVLRTYYVCSVPIYVHCTIKDDGPNSHAHVDFGHKEERLGELTRAKHKRSEMQQGGGKETAASLMRSLSKPSSPPSPPKELPREKRTLGSRALGRKAGKLLLQYSKFSSSIV